MAVSLEHLTKNQRIIFYLLLLIPTLLAILATIQRELRPLSNQPQLQLSPTIAPTISLGQVEQKLQIKTALSPTDQQAKERLLTETLGESDSGIVYESPRVWIEYIGSADTFQAEVRTDAVLETKAEVEKWLLDQGISREGICNLPIIFYGFETTAGFTPLPEHC